MKLHIRNNQMEEVEGLRNEYPYAFHHVSLRLTEVPWHWHEALEFNLVLEGQVKVSTSNQTQIFRKGEAFFLNSNVLAAMDNVSDCILDSHLFHPVFLSGHFKSVFETKYLNPVIQNRNLDLVALRGTTAEEIQILKKLQQLAKLQSEQDTEFQTRNLLSEIWLYLLEVIKQADSSIFHAPQKNQDRILTMIAYIQENFAEKITLEDIADSAAVSTRECLRCFKTSIHQSPMEYLIEYRIRAAKKLLETTDLSITEIALRCGFNSNSYFTKLFHRICGKTPNACRKELQALEQSKIK
ncbi:MAG: AraC family transcriptional regulator [Oscillospiraceae bacterium]|nr:AraC family transcriptional regulator [Oscillospiraceae bacterium]